MNALRVERIEVSALQIPMRLRFEHAAASRNVADPIIVRVFAAPPYAGCVGAGETLARPYVSGETTDSVMSDVAESFAPLVASFRARHFAEALAAIDALPFERPENNDATGGLAAAGQISSDAGVPAQSARSMCAARCAIELALLDLAGQVMSRRAADAAGWLGLPGFGAPGSLRSARYSGIVLGSGYRLPAMLRAQYAWGLRDFKLKAAVPGWLNRLHAAHRVLRRAIRKHRATLRVDANGGWTLDEAREAVPHLETCEVAAIEQPLAPSHDAAAVQLAASTSCPLVADESLVTPQDGERLARRGAFRIWNIRVAKNGGLLAALRLAGRALQAGFQVQLGCLVGETSILSAAGLAFLEACPGVRFVEGAFGGWLLKGDVTQRRVQFGFGGRPRALPGSGLGVRVEEPALRRWTHTKRGVAL